MLRATFACAACISCLLLRSGTASEQADAAVVSPDKAVPASGAVVWKWTDRDEFLADVFIDDTGAGAPVFFRSLDSVLDHNAAYTQGHVYVTKIVQKAPTRVELWRYAATGAGEAVHRNPESFIVSPVGDFVAVAAANEVRGAYSLPTSLDIARADGTGIEHSMPTSILLGNADAKKHYGLALLGWNSTGREVWYSVHKPEYEGGQTIRLGVAELPTLALDTFGLDDIDLTGWFALNADTRRVVYLRPLLELEPIENPEADNLYPHVVDDRGPGAVMVHDLLSGRTIRLGQVGYDGSPVWVNDSTVEVHDRYSEEHEIFIVPQTQHTTTPDGGGE